jgi:hypothetical protein
MDGLGAIIGLTLRIVDAITHLLHVLWILFIGIPGVLRRGVGFWNKDRDKDRTNDRS